MLFSWFERRVHPYPEAVPGPAPRGFFAFLWVGTEGLRPFILGMMLLTATIGAFEALLFAMLGSVVDWLALLLLAAGYYWRGAFYLGFAMCLAVFLTTQSFLFTFTPAWQAFTVLSSSGVFLVKDLWFIANMLLITQAFNTRTILASH